MLQNCSTTFESLLPTPFDINHEFRLYTNNALSNILHCLFPNMNCFAFLGSSCHALLAKCDSFLYLSSGRPNLSSQRYSKPSVAPSYISLTNSGQTGLVGFISILLGFRYSKFLPLAII